MKRVQSWELWFLLLVILVAVTSLSLAGEESRKRLPPVPSETAPEAFAVAIETSKGAFVIEAYRPWAPRAADRFFNLVKSGYFDGNVFFHVKLANTVKFGIHSDPERTEMWAPHGFRKDPPLRQVQAGDVFMLSESSWLSSASQVGIQTGLDATEASRAGVMPFGRIVEGIEVLDTLDDSHMRKPRKHWKMIRQLIKHGDKKIRKKYPSLDSISKATLLDRLVKRPPENFPKPEPLPTDLPAGEGIVRLYRPDVRAGRIQNFNLRVDGKLRAALKPNNLFEISLPAGSHEFSGKVKFKLFASGLLDQAMASRSKYAIDVKPGTIYYLRAIAGAIDGRTLILTLVSPDLGAEEIRGLVPAKEVRAEKFPNEEDEDAILAE